MSLKQVSDISSETGREAALAPTDCRALMAVAPQEIETWVEALAHYDNNEFEESLKAFDAIADTARILFNCGVIHATLGDHQKAVSSVPVLAEGPFRPESPDRRRGEVVVGRG